MVIMQTKQMGWNSTDSKCQYSWYTPQNLCYFTQGEKPREARLMSVKYQSKQ